MTKEKRKPTGILKDGATEVVFTVLNLILCKQQFFHTEHFFFQFSNINLYCYCKIGVSPNKCEKKRPEKKEIKMLRSLLRFMTAKKKNFFFNIVS